MCDKKLKKKEEKEMKHKGRETQHFFVEDIFDAQNI